MFDFSIHSAELLCGFHSTGDLFGSVMNLECAVGYDKELNGSYVQSPPGDGKRKVDYRADGVASKILLNN